MNYEQLIETVSLIVEHPNINKDGLMLTYELSLSNHKKMNELLYYKANPSGRDFKSSDEFEVEIGGILVKFVKRKSEENLDSTE